MALQNPGGLNRSLAFTALHDAGLPCDPDDVTALLASYEAWMDGREFKAGVSDIWTYTRTVYQQGRKPAEETGTVRDAVITSLRWQPDRTGRTNAPWRLGLTRGNNTDVEWMTQDELIGLWEQIGVAFGLEGAGTAMTPKQRASTLNPEGAR